MCLSKPWAYRTPVCERYGSTPPSVSSFPPVCYTRQWSVCDYESEKKNKIRTSLSFFTLKNFTFLSAVFTSNHLIEKKYPQMSPCLSKLSHTAFVFSDTYDSPSLRSSINRKSFRQWLTSNFQRHVSQIIWICRHKGGWRVSVYLWHRSQSLRSCLLLFRPLLCSLQDVLKQQTTTFYFWTNGINRIHFFRLNANKGIRLRQGALVCLLMGDEAASLSGADYPGLRTFHKATHRDELRLLTFDGLQQERRRVSYRECTVAFCVDTWGTNPKVAKANCIGVTLQ